MTKNERLQALIYRYKQETGEKAVDMERIADWAIRQGAILPKPKTARELFAAELADAARAEYRIDPETGLSYRANHALRNRTRDGKQLVLWVDMEDATRPQMLWSLTNRHRLDTGLVLCVGAAMEFAVGLKVRAPRWMQVNGLEWLWRLGSEPRKLWRRYLLSGPRFITLVIREWRSPRKPGL